MKIDLNNAITLISGLVLVVSTIYRLAQMEASIISKISALDKKVDIHVKEYDERNKHYDYLFHDLDKKIIHQANRIKDWIDQIATHLHDKAGFVIRDRKL